MGEISILGVNYPFKTWVCRITYMCCMEVERERVCRWFPLPSCQEPGSRALLLLLLLLFLPSVHHPVCRWLHRVTATTTVTWGSPSDDSKRLQVGEIMPGQGGQSTEFIWNAAVNRGYMIKRNHCRINQWHPFVSNSAGNNEAAPFWPRCMIFHYQIPKG